MKDNLLEIKAIFVAVFAGFTAVLGTAAIPIYVLVGLGIIDYITGILAAPYRNEKINSYKGIKGITKKVCMLLLVGVGLILDWLIVYAGGNIGFSIGIDFMITALVTVWLISNELISLLENLADIGVKMPKFLMKLVEKIKTASDIEIE